MSDTSTSVKPLIVSINAVIIAFSIPMQKKTMLEQLRKLD
jgi:hypothetical protein